MAIDVTGGLDGVHRRSDRGRPTAPTYREGTSMWVWDDQGQVGLPRVAVEAVGATWETAQMATLNLALPGGRVLWLRDEPPHPVADEQGRPRILGAGPLRFVCVEPFRSVAAEFDGPAVVTSVDEQIAGRGSAAGAGATPNGCRSGSRSKATWSRHRGRRARSIPTGSSSLGEDRIEQLFSASGSVTIDGDTISLRGGGLRIHRKGGNRSDYNDFFGHCWQSTAFPSGRAFGYIHYTPRPDGSIKYHEGWVMDGGEILPAKVVDTPWLARHGTRR